MSKVLNYSQKVLVIHDLADSSYDSILIQFRDASWDLRCVVAEKNYDQIWRIKLSWKDTDNVCAGICTSCQDEQTNVAYRWVCHKHDGGYDRSDRCDFFVRDRSWPAKMIDLFANRAPGNRQSSLSKGMRGWTLKNVISVPVIDHIKRKSLSRATGFHWRLTCRERNSLQEFLRRTIEPSKIAWLMERTM